jgi:hypothetical protein
MSEWQVVVIMVLMTIVGVRATAPVRDTGCAPSSLSAKCRIAPR